MYLYRFTHKRESVHVLELEVAFSGEDEGMVTPGRKPAQRKLLQIDCIAKTGHVSSLDSLV